MKKSYRFLISALFLGAYLLSACSGAVMPQQDDSSQSPAGSQFTEVVFTGAVESMGGGQWQISGQSVNVDSSTAVDANVQVGDIVKVEARVSQDGAVFALKIESSLPDDTGANSNDGNANDGNTNDDNANANGNANTNDAANANSNDDNNNGTPSGPEQEAFGVVEAITTDSITIGGITYKIANFTEFKSLIAVGDQVKIHVIVNADGSLTIREIEKTAGTTLGNGNDNGDDNSNLNSNDDGSNANSNDDDSNDDNSNDNDDNGNGSNDND